MAPQRSNISLQTRVESIVPSLLGWRTYPRALANLLLFGLVALAGEWLVHQVEYLIEYGHRYGTVMGSTPHRFYMTPLGLMFALVAAALLVVAARTLQTACIKRRRLLRLLPSRLRRHVPTCSPSMPTRLLARSALALAACQITIYLAQENLESAALGQGWPGLSVLLAPHHATVTPLHLLVAICSSLLLWTFSTWLQGSRRAVRVAQLFVEIVTAAHTVAPRLTPSCNHVPNLRLIAGALCLRSPPLAA